ncbi:MAG: PorP/SprF family type IX secretion system membrane protein [Bacteroidota bacterium]
MKNLTYIASFAIFMLAASAQGWSQQQGMFNMHWSNMMYMNPAYAGQSKQLNATLYHRQQWIGFKDAPITSALSFDAPIARTKISYGGEVYHDVAGPLRQTRLSGNLAYRTALDANGTYIALGLKFSSYMLGIDLTYLDSVNTADQTYFEDVRGLVQPNVGAGVMFYGEKYFIGLSSPNMHKMRFKKESNNGTNSFNASVPVHYLSGGFSDMYSQRMRFKVNGFLRASQGAPVSFGLNAELIYYDTSRFRGKKDRFSVGTGYNFRERFYAYTNVRITNEIVVGYAAAIPANWLIHHNAGSHELMIQVRIPGANYRNRSGAFTF